MGITDYKILFIHGYTATPKTDFYPALSPLLDSVKADYIIPRLPGDKHPHSNEWLHLIHESVKNCSKPLIIIGHSLGTRAALLYIERYKPQVECLILIAAFANRVENAQRKDGDSYPDFFSHKINTEKVKNMVKKSYVLHSRDDHSIAYEQGVEIAKDLNAELITFTDRDHFSSSTNAPFILTVLRDKLGF